MTTRMETQSDLNQETVETLQELVQVNIDSRDGFRYSAEKMDIPAVVTYFEELAAQRDAQAAELQDLIAASGEEPKDSGSFAASLHRSWLGIKEALGGGDQSVLNEAERGEDKIKEKYEEALQNNPATAVSDLLHRHMQNIKASHDRVRELRDVHQETK